jgi:hypothetical protein
MGMFPVYNLISTHYIGGSVPVRVSENFSEKKKEKESSFPVLQSSVPF